jgi:hypothetical protein
MKNVTRKHRARKSTVEAARVTPHGTPRGEPSSPRGLNGRKSYLTIRPVFDGWTVVQVDFEGALGYRRETIVVSGCRSALEASQELALWCEGTGLPCVDLWNRDIDPAGDPGWR